jgi:hypothetical protein
MVAPYWLALHFSFHPITALPPTPCLLRELYKVSKIESMKYAQLKTTDPTSRQRRRPTSLNQ